MDKIKELRTYMEMKYGKNYMTAIAKLNIPNPYDEHGIIKPENVLTSEEKSALMFYIPETRDFIDVDEDIKRRDMLNKKESIIDNSKEENFLLDNDKLKDLSIPKLQKIRDLAISDVVANNLEYPNLEDKPKSR